MRAREFMEQAPFKNNKEDELRRALQRDIDIPVMPTEKDWRTDPEARRKKEKEQALELPPVSPEDLIGTGIFKAPALAAVNTLSKTAPKKLSTKISDITYDLKNKPNPLNPMTIKDVGTEKATIKYHADNVFRKKYGMEPPTYDIDKDLKRFGGTDAYRKASNDYATISNDFQNRGYNIGGRVPEIGANIDSTDLLTPRTRIPSASAKEKFQDIVDKEAFRIANPLNMLDFSTKAVANRNRNNDENK